MKDIAKAERFWYSVIMANTHKIIRSRRERALALREAQLARWQGVKKLSDAEEIVGYSLNPDANFTHIKADKIRKCEAEIDRLRETLGVSA